MLIGDPGITVDSFTLNLFDFPIKYSPLSEEETNDLKSEIWAGADPVLLKDLDNNSHNLPVPESKLAVDVGEGGEVGKGFTYNFLIYGNCKDSKHYCHLPALIVSAENSVQRYILMPGSEDPDGPYSIEDFLFVRFINWLARK